MACPWFSPTEEADFAARPRPARAPLGTVFAGRCLAHAEPVKPADDLLYEPCNFGYPRGRCPAFPPETEADAVRFSGTLWILEKDHRPLRHGSCAGPFPSPIVEAQAEAYRKHVR